MRRWNGWGDDSTSMALPLSAGRFLTETLGVGHYLKEADLADVIKLVPESRLPEHPLITVDAEVRVRHAKGQSLPDYIAMRSGQIDTFPDGVCFPENSQDVKHILAYAKQHDIELIPYGGGTSVAGHINPKQSIRPVLTINMGRMNQLIHLDEQSQVATFGAGTPGPMVEAQLLAKGYTLGHFPQSFELSTIGGWIASRSSGQQSLRYGRIEQLFAGGSLETFAGTLEVPTFPASSAGPDLREIMLGSEGRFGILTQVKVRVSKVADKETFAVAFFPTWEDARGFCQQAAQQRIPMSMLRVSNGIETHTQLKLAGHENAIKWLERYLAMRGCTEGKCMLTYGLTGSNKQISASKQQLNTLFKQFNGVNTGQVLGKKWQANRFRSPYLRDALWEQGYVVDTFETATDWQNVDQLMAKVEEKVRVGLKDENEKVHVFTHLSHVYSQGCSLYTTYVYRNGTSFEQTLKRWQQLKHLASDTIVNNGGTISHQHGVGKDHAPYLVKEKGQQGMNVLANLAAHFDEKQLLNPGTLIE